MNQNSTLVVLVKRYEVKNNHTLDLNIYIYFIIQHDV